MEGTILYIKSSWQFH